MKKNQSEKRCQQCQSVKPIDQFHINNAKPDGRSNCCSDCDNERKRANKARLKAAISAPENAAPEPVVHEFAPENPDSVIVSGNPSDFIADGPQSGSIPASAIFPSFMPLETIVGSTQPREDFTERLTITLDFSDHVYLLEGLKKQAQKSYRTPENQLFSVLDRYLKSYDVLNCKIND